METRFPGLRITRFHAAPGERIRKHSHDAFHIFCLLDGDMEQESGDSSCRLRPGAVRASPANSVHAIDFGAAGAECLVVHITDPGLARVAVPAEGASRFFDDIDLGRLFARLPADAVSDPAGLWLGVREILALIHRWRQRPEPGSTPDWLVEARSLLLDWEPHAGSCRIANIAGVSQEHLARSFRRHYGVTPSEVRRIAMLARAVRLLQSGDVSLVDAALDAGFAHQSHLTNVMRHMLGTTPGEYRQRLIAPS